MDENSLKVGSNEVELVDFRILSQQEDEAYGENLADHLKLIISDVEMPRMDGFHFAANAKEDGRFAKIPIVFNSSISDHFSVGKGIEAGGEAYLVKFEASTFYDEVAGVVRAHMK